MTQITGSWLAKAETQMALSILTDAGYAAYLVGGAVRDALLERPVGDLDVATDALPEDVTRIFAAAGHKVIPTGADHGTVTAVLGGHPFEITTFRKDVETDGRRAVVAYSRNVSDDAHRRDFTMNALYARADGTVIDPLGSGLADLRAHRVRFIDDPADRIREDYLRILRFFRFNAWYGAPESGLDPEALAAVAGLLEGLDKLSAERVGGELVKLLSAPDPAPSVAAMAAAGVIGHVLPGANAEALPVLIHHEGALGLCASGVRRLACIGGENVAERLRLSRAQARQLETLVVETGSARSVSELAYRYDADTALSVVALRAALLDVLPPEDAQAAAALGAGVQFPVTAADLMPELEGPALGARLKKLEAQWIASGFTATKLSLLRSGQVR